MKKIILSLLVSSVILTGCFETTQEITINDDGTGTVKTTSDLSSALGLAKQMGGGADMDKITGQKVDTSFSLAPSADSLSGLSEKEKEILKKGTMYMYMNGSEEKFYTRLSFPFSNPEDLKEYDILTSKISSAKMKQLMATAPNGAALAGVPDISSFDKYYDLKYEHGEFKKSLNKEKYAELQNDDYLKSMQQVVAMGISVTSTWIINLPHPVTKLEGKNAKLSDDKMKVTVKVSIDELFESPENLEFKIKY